MAYFSQNYRQDDIKKLREKLEFDFVGGYLFWGEEEYLKNYYREAVRKKIRDEGMAEFNLVNVSFEKGGKLSDISDAINTPPVLAPHKLIEITGLDINTLKKDEEKILIDMLSGVADDTVILFYFHFDELDISTKKAKEKKIIRSLAQELLFVEFPRQPKNKLLSWTDKFFTSESLHISDVCLNRMIDLCDFSMTRLKSESEKLICRAKYGNLAEVPSEWIGEMVKPSAENELYELSDAILMQERARAVAVFENLVQQNFEPTVIFGAISKTVCTLSTLSSAYFGGIRCSDAANTVGLAAWQADKYYKIIPLRTFKGIKISLDECFECDKGLKGESSNKILLLNSLVISLVSERCK